MELQTCTTACLGDTVVPFAAVGGIVVVALVVLVIAFALSRRKK